MKQNDKIILFQEKQIRRIWYSLRHHLIEAALLHELKGINHQHILADIDAFRASNTAVHIKEIGRASCRERVWRYV